MAWFDDLDLPGATITGQFGWVHADSTDDDTDPDITLASGTVRFEATATAVRNGNAWIGIAPVTAFLFDGEIWADEEGSLPLRILSTDADTGVTGWGWRAIFTIRDAPLTTITFRAPASGVHLTGDDLIPITGNPAEVIEGIDGTDGASAFEVAVANGFTGTEAEWLASLRGEKGEPGGSTWDDVTGKPDTFPPSPHTHTITEVEGLEERLPALTPEDLGTRHLDTVTTPGDYTQIFASRATKAQGYPRDGSAGVLEIKLWNPASSNVIAVYTPWQAEAIAKRTYYNGAWQVWRGIDGTVIT